MQFLLGAAVFGAGILTGAALVISSVKTAQGVKTSGD